MAHPERLATPVARLREPACRPLAPLAHRGTSGAPPLIRGLRKEKTPVGVSVTLRSRLFWGKAVFAIVFAALTCGRSTLNAPVFKNSFWLFLKMAHPERLELPTNWFEASYSIQLSYGCAPLE